MLFDLFQDTFFLSLSQSSINDSNKALGSDESIKISALCPRYHSPKSHQSVDRECVLVLLGYEPMEGDWVQAKYYINSTQWTTQAQSVAPLRYCRLDQVKKKFFKVTSA